MASNAQQPEVYWTKPNAHCPNSKLPVLVYRNVLPSDLSEESVSKAIAANHWVKGGVFKHYPTAHFHSNVHECYAALRGKTTCLYGVGPLDDASDGVEFDMQAGDIAVHAAGVAHRNTWSTDDYVYMGLYPKGAPKWSNNFCKDGVEETERKTEQARSIPVPEWDPIHGFDGPLPTIWRQASVA
ncbi:hypothetical protein LTR37_010119 [Vermiconidia calcicola]|uniref:Uncharacterized protein n=1 Tax=Vermiconidia calcicola TaxID=1690605 RepID=A0ACC3N5U0_9PEZI|nr:hypothetical protein LTR37_010119 [Vermiconidia calcicola]